jgi:AraC-type DNA-binding domain-containing proteins
MEEFDLKALITAKENMIIHLLQNYARVNHVVICLLDNNSLIVKTFGCSADAEIMKDLSQKKDLSNLGEQKRIYHIEYAQKPLRIQELGQIVGKIGVICQINKISPGNFRLYEQLQGHSLFLSDLIDNVSKLIFESVGLDRFIIKHPVNVDDLIYDLNDEESSALKQLRKLSTMNESVITAVNFIDSHLDQHLTLDQVAKKVYLSDFYFSKLFKKETNLSFFGIFECQKDSTGNLIIKGYGYEYQ